MILLKLQSKGNNRSPVCVDPTVRRVFFTLLIVLFSIESFGTHLRGGQITMTPVDCTSGMYQITLTLYTNTNSPVHVSNGLLNFGDGQLIRVPEQFATLIDSTNAVGLVTFKINHQYLSTGRFTVSYFEQNRNNGVLNFVYNLGNGGITFYIESLFTINPSLCGHFMTFAIPPTDRACSGIIFTHNPGVIFSNGDSVSYQLTEPLAGNSLPVPGYQVPNAANFYAGKYNSSNEQGNGPPTYSIDADGSLKWDAPGMVGEYGVAMKVFLWVKIDSTWTNTAWITRDMQIIVEDCNAVRPSLALPANMCVKAGDMLTLQIRGYSKTFRPVIIEYTLLDNFYSSPPVFKNAKVLQSTAQPYDTANLKMKWNVSCDQVRPTPYRFVFKISSFTSTGIRISSFQTWDVTVKGPPPQYRSLTLDLATKKLDIQWNDYPCANAKNIQIWRRVDQGPSSHDPCLSGIPKSWGFTKIGETMDSNFTDKNLSPGATYCYRLIAIYTTPYQTVSIASKDTCIGPIVADAPVVTNVSVNSTDRSNGAILVRWTPPFQINKSLFPSPYMYDVFRTADGKTYKTIISKTSDTTFIDTQLDVIDTLYGYKMVVYAPQSIAHNNPIDTSALAFYPRLTYQSSVDSIKLSWDSQVPWSNQSPRFPMHFIYSKEFGTSKYVLIDSVDVMAAGDFVYKNYSSQKSFPLQSNTVYQYKIETQGVYGNPHIQEPLRNFSNEIVAQAVDKKAPCAPTLEISSADCETVLNSPCTSSALTNHLNWTYSAECGNDIAYYQVIFSEQQDSDSTLLASTSDLVYHDPKKDSRAGCYQVFAVDRSGNVGAASNTQCVENCGYVYLPNVITVNNDGLNESFPALSDVSEDREPAKCPRFVKEFSFQIYDRLGQQVFAADNPGAEWSGTDKNGKELPSGIYYYTAKIFFYTLKPESQSQHVKGWVNLVR